MANPIFNTPGAQGADTGGAGTPYTAHVVKPSGAGVSPGHTLNDFRLTAFQVPGRLAPGLTREELRLQNLERQLADEKKLARALAIKAESDKAQAEREAYAKGLAEGEKKAGEAHQTELQKLRNSYQEILNDLGTHKTRLFRSFEAEALRLVMVCVRKLFKHIADEHEDAVLPVVREAVASLDKAHALVVKVNPADLPLVEQGMTDWLPMQADTDAVKLVADPRIVRSCCLVESEGASTGLDYRAVAEAMEVALQKAHHHLDKGEREETHDDVGA